MKKSTLLLIALTLWGGTTFAQVLTHVSTSYNAKWGIGVNAGTGYAVGRTFYIENNSGITQEVTPKEYRQAVVNPSFSLDFWREGYTEPWFVGALFSVGRGTTKYSATFDNFDTTLTGESISWNLLGSFYVGYRISDKLNVALGLTADVSSPRALDLFANRYTIGLMAMARYYVSENFYATARLQGGIPVFRDWNGYGEYWSGGVRASDKKMTTLSLMAGVGFRF